MSKLLQKAIEQAQRLPEDEQDAAAGALMDYLDQLHSLHLSDEQAAEVRRRLAEPNPKTLSLAEARARLQRLGE